LRGETGNVLFKFIFKVLTGRRRVRGGKKAKLLILSLKKVNKSGSVRKW
jgi:hypothetical protein